jgi:dolichol-phosphate mannosyltransferase
MLRASSLVGSANAMPSASISVGSVTAMLRASVWTRQVGSCFTRFGVVGATGTGLNLSVFSLLTSLLHVEPLQAATLSFELAMCSNFLLNDRWTFRHRRRAGEDSLIGALARYQLVALGGLVLNLLVLQALVNVLAVMPLVANATGIVAAMAWNFTLSLGWAWRWAHPVAHSRTSSA